MTEIQAKISGILISQFETDRATLTPATRFQEDLEADSLEVVELIMSVEEAFDIEVPDEDAETLRTVGDLVGYIERKQTIGNA